MKAEQFSFGTIQGLSSQDKKKLKKIERKTALGRQKDKLREGETYGSLKVSRRIPREIAEAVSMRDAGRDFGRPNHSCEKPGAPHHIIHFEKFLNEEVEGSPHTVLNLECPCDDCHKLAHEMRIPSGVSIEDFFRQNFGDILLR